MLTRIRLEVSDEDSAAAASEALDKYERALHATEGERYGLINSSPEAQPIQSGECDRVHLPEWTADWPNDFADKLGREVTDEVIEYDPSLPGYKGRRVVQFRRVDTRNGKGETVDPKGTEGTSGVSGVNVILDGKHFKQTVERVTRGGAAR